MLINENEMKEEVDINDLEFEQDGPRDSFVQLMNYNKKSMLEDIECSIFDESDLMNLKLDVLRPD